MRKVGRIFGFWASIMMLLATASCSMDDYETGDGDYSYLCAEFADARSGEGGMMKYAVTDGGDSLVFQPVFACKWMSKPDTTYRALVYYSRKEAALPVVECVAAHQVLVMRVLPDTARKINNVTDPVVFESAWVGDDSRYLNLGLFVKIGKDDDQNRKQLLGIACDSIKEHPDGSKMHFLRLLHDQNGVPENYSTRLYASIPLEDVAKGDEVQLRANTYNGEVIRTFVK